MRLVSCLVAENRIEKGGKGKTMKLTKKLLYTSIAVVFLVSMALVNVASASPDTHFWVNPPYIAGTPDGEFEVAINVADAPETFAWEVYLSWDPDRLELVGVEEGDFLHRWETNPFPPPDYFPKYATSIAYTPLDEANLEGEIIVTCTLIGSAPWAPGDGLLMSLEFLVQAEGAAHLDLFNTRLWDHMEAGYPAPTYYPNEDGLVDATSFFYAGLAGWKLKVNGKAGVGLGLKTTVGTENLLEAKFKNTGNFDAYVQAFFEIRDSAGYWIDTIPSSTVLLTAGGSTTLSATWTADGAGVYYITAYSFYGELAPTIPDGFSRTLRIRAVS